MEKNFVSQIYNNNIQIFWICSVIDKNILFFCFQISLGFKNLNEFKSLFQINIFLIKLINNLKYLKNIYSKNKKN